MNFLEQILRDAGLLGVEGRLDDAVVRNCGLIRDRSGQAIARLEKAANGVDILIRDYSSGRILGRIPL